MLARKIKGLLSCLKPRKLKIAQEDENMSGEETILVALPHEIDENMSGEETILVALPHEIIVVEILTRIPVKSLLRFKCVCKAWRCLVSDSKFIQMHLSRAIERDSENLLLASTPYIVKRKCKLSSWDVDGKYYKKSVKYINQAHMYRVEGYQFNEAVEIRNPLEPSLDKYLVLGSCNGLICMCRQNSLCLFNPATREYKIIGLQKKIDFVWGCHHGFGYDGVDDDYKFVQVSERYYSSHEYSHEWDYSVAEIYSVRDCTWSTTSNIPYRIGHNSGIFLNEAFHWIAKSNTSKLLKSIILSCNTKGVFREVPHPYDNVSEKTHYGINLGTLKEKLCMIGQLYDCEIEIWVMNNYCVSDSWTKLCSMEHTVIPSLKPYYNLYFLIPHIRPLYIFKNGEILIKDGLSLVLYNPKEKTSRNLEMQGIPAWIKIGQITTYIETLVPLQSGTYV